MIVIVASSGKSILNVSAGIPRELLSDRDEKLAAFTRQIGKIAGVQPDSYVCERDNK